MSHFESVKFILVKLSKLGFECYLGDEAILQFILIDEHVTYRPAGQVGICGANWERINEVKKLWSIEISGHFRDFTR